MSHHLKSNYSDSIVLDVTPESANWDYLSFRIVKLGDGQVYLHQTGDDEVALVPLAGSGTACKPPPATSACAALASSRRSRPCSTCRPARNSA